jgi:hypothetical protein
MAVRCTIWLALALVLGLGAVLQARTGHPAPGNVDGRVFIAAGSDVDFRVVIGSLPTTRLGPTALAALDALDSGAGVALPSLLGEAPADMPPPGWPGRSLAGTPGAAAGSMPVDMREGKSACDCATDLSTFLARSPARSAASPAVSPAATGPGDDARARRVAVLYATRSFTVDSDPAGIRLLRLRARYHDGLVAYVNGREVARRNLAPEDRGLALAQHPHGPEWETFYIPVVPGLLTRGTNLLAVEVRPSGQRQAPALDLELAAATRARIVRGPMLQQVGPTSATIVFETDLPTEAVVEHGPTPARGQATRSAGGGLAMRHVVTLRDLPAGQPVHYRVIAGSDVSADLVLHPAPAPGAVLRFAVYGDVRGGHDVHARLVAAMLDEAPDLVLATGDMVLRGTDEADWQRFFEVTAPLLARVPYYPVVGNHDMGQAGDERRRMNEIFLLWPAPPERPEWGHWYAFDVAGVHFVMLDSNAYEHAEQLAWLERDLRAARKRGVHAIFAAVHDGPYSRGLHRGNQYAAEHYVPLLARHGVTLLFAGHEHLYQRGRAGGLDYMVSGGGGAPLYSVRCGVRGRPRCDTPDGMQHVASEHHYILVTVYREHVEACPRRADGTPLERCITYRLGRR